MEPWEKQELTKRETQLRDKVQKLIQYCDYCQPYDEGEVVWILGDKIELYDLLDDCKIPEKSWDKIITHLYCPHCSHSGFGLGLNVGLKTKFDIEVDKHMDEVYAVYGGEVKDFEDHLEKFPLLAYQHSFGRKLFNELKVKKLPVIEIEGNLFRARRVEGAEILETEKMFNPPTGKPKEGRFNHAGQSHLYLASDKNSAIKKFFWDNISALVWWQEFTVEEKILNVLDLSFDWSALSPSTSTLLLSLKVYNSLGRSDRNKDNWRPDYYLTRFIMDCAKSLGYNGIKYNSSKSYLNFDLVLFYPDAIKLKALGKPSIEIYIEKDDKGPFDSNYFEHLFEGK